MIIINILYIYKHIFRLGFPNTERTVSKFTKAPRLRLNLMKKAFNKYSFHFTRSYIITEGIRKIKLANLHSYFYFKRKFRAQGKVRQQFLCLLKVPVSFVLFYHYKLAPKLG